MTNGTVPKPSVAYYDFYKTNVGGAHDTTWYPVGASMTRQEFAEECDINSLMKRYEGHAVGGPGNLAPVEPMYVDFTQVPRDLMSYMSFMDEAQASFMSLPAVVRKEFDNSAIDFVAFASDPGNLEQMRSWGLAPPAKAPQAAAGEPSPAPASAAAAPGGASGAPPGSSTHGST